MTKYYKARIAKKHGINILALEFTKAIPMCLMFMRFQEYSEGIRKVRDHDPMPEGDVMYHYYRKTKKLYHKAGWSGFNLRGDLFNEFINKSAAMPFNILENSLLRLVDKNFRSKGDKFFIIAYMKGDKATRKHELMHALYYNNPAYKYHVDKILDRVSTKEAGKYLRKLGYRFSGKHGDYIFNDEIQAYVLSDTKKIIKQFGLSSKTLKKLQKLKRDCF